MSDALRAFKALRDNWDRYSQGGNTCSGLCFWIGRLHRDGLISWDEGRAAGDLLTERLQGFFRVTGWLSSNSPDYRAFLDSCDVNSTKLDSAKHDYRRRWLDHLIQELENENAQIRL